MEPSLAFVLADDAGPVGYVIGALDSREYEQRAEREWWPPLRERYPDPEPDRRPEWTADQRCAHAIHHPSRGAADLLTAYPSHLHINLLPRGQGNGHGRRLIETLCDALRARSSTGVHLGTGRRNRRAVGFYRHVGFTELESTEDIVLFGMRL